MGFVTSHLDRQVIRRLAVLSSAAVLLACASLAVGASSGGTVPCTSSHVKDQNPDLARVSDTLICFKAYLSNFDTDKSDVDGDGKKYWVSRTG